VAAEHLRLVWQVAVPLHAVEHLLRSALKQSAAAHREEIVSREQRFNLWKVIREVSSGVACKNTNKETPATSTRANKTVTRAQCK
jgi:hypothetical protein